MPLNNEVIITAGGTQEPIDDVRYISNFSSGRFGLALAQAYAEHGHGVTLLAPDSTAERFGLPQGVDHIPFTSTESLRDALLAQQAARLILHAAAVSDYTPERIPGKISSDSEQLTIQLRRTPKILGLLRGNFGPDVIIAGFKLLSGVTPEALTTVARAQIEQNQTDYCVANLLDDIGSHGATRTVQLVSAEGLAMEFEGLTIEVARSLYDAIDWEGRSS